jgi:hypothetical protein
MDLEITWGDNLTHHYADDTKWDLEKQTDGTLIVKWTTARGYHERHIAPGYWSEYTILPDREPT